MKYNLYIFNIKTILLSAVAVTKLNIHLHGSVTPTQLKWVEDHYYYYQLPIKIINSV